MSTKVIVSYDGTHNEDDAVVLGRLLAQAGAEVSLAYVRHGQELESSRETLAQAEAEALLQRGVSLLGTPGAATHVVSDPSTPEGLRKLAARVGAELIVFCSDSHTATGHIAIGNSAQRLLDGGTTAVGIAPAGLAQLAQEGITRIATTEDTAGDSSARRTAEALAGALGASVTSAADAGSRLLIVGSRPEAEQGRVALSSASERLVENATCPVLVVPRGVALTFGAPVALAG
jgi:nucleotide-binding universal stress UspA family protein